MYKIIDAHLDLGGILLKKKEQGPSNILESLLPKSHVKLVVAAIFIENSKMDNPLREAMLQIQIVKEAVKSSDQFLLVYDDDTFKHWQQSDQIGIILSLEGAEPILRDLSLLDIFYDLGVRGLGLTWSRRNYVADGSYFRAPREGTQGGLTPFGIEVVEHAEKLGYFIDVSHINDAGFEDVLKYSNKPLIASHSNARMLNEIPRNLTDHQLKAIGDVQGVVGANGYRFIVDPEVHTLDRLCDHIEHMLKVAGEDSVGFGFDLCNMYYDDGKKHDVLERYEDVSKIYDVLKARGISQEAIEKVFYKNFEKFFSNHFKTNG